MTYYNLTEPLTDKARKDLCASIVNWSYRINNDVSGCPLCRVYHLNYKICRNIDLACDGCPVKMVTKKSFCKGTPYDMGYFDKSDDYRINELEFLLSILIQDRKLRKAAMLKLLMVAQKLELI